MSRTADYTIKGFLYQFNKTLLEILNSSDESNITVEGIDEDVEIETPSELTLIQCKYHEASDSFTPSKIFKPLLQMMHHFYTHPGASIRYILFAHYPSVSEMSVVTVGKVEFQAALASESNDLLQYITKLNGNIDLDTFGTKFTIQFGSSFDTLVTMVCASLKKNGIPEEDIDTLAYPNAIHIVAGLSVKHDPTERSITKLQFLEQLKVIRKTAISRWTLALSTRKQLLDARRKQLKPHLDKNSRLRYLVVDSKSIDDYETEIVFFVSDYLEKYHFKIAHINTPVLCLCTSEDDFRGVQWRLHKKGIRSTDGYVGNNFDESLFFREPLSRTCTGGAIVREFSLRLLRWENNGYILNNQKCDDLFIIGEPNCDSLNTVDVNVEYLAAASLREVKYIMGVSNVYE